MTYEKSNELVESTLQDLRTIFLSKGAEYSINQIDDRFHHFRLMVNKYLPGGVTHFQLADKMLTLRSKQEVCIEELIHTLISPQQLQDGKKTKVYIDEKFNDFIIYTMLLKLLVLESYGIEVEKEV